MNFSIEVENFRCFASPGAVDVRPLTILVGENSAGKSSFLAAIQIALSAISSGGPPDFNQAPFSLGAFDQIAHAHGGKLGRAKNFRFKLARQSAAKNQSSASVEYFFRKHGAQAELFRQTMTVGSDVAEAELSGENVITLRVESGGREFETKFPADSIRPGVYSETIVDLRYLLYRARYPMTARAEEMPKTEETARTNALVRMERNIHMFLRDFAAIPLAMSPIRSKPLRTYQPTSSLPAADGSHIPLMLAKNYFDDKKNWTRLKQIIDEFGKSSGMFDEIDLKPLGKHESDPFQLRLKLGGALVNIVDVGYGVSQVLPIIVEAALAERSQLFLLQQPEVHLHPRAQAALATFLMRIMKRSSVSFVVETHSDFFLNRLLTEIREHQMLKKDDLSILFFNREGRESRIYDIDIDERGNIIKFPDAYREFFLAEEHRFLGL